MLVWNWCPTRVRLLNLGFQTDPNCLFCNADHESITHCFPECFFTWPVWRVLACIFKFPSPKIWNAPLLQLENFPWNKVVRSLLLLFWQVTFYNLWSERNKRPNQSHFTGGIIKKIKFSIKNRIKNLQYDPLKFSSSFMKLWLSS